MHLLQHLSEDNLDGGMGFCEWVVNKQVGDTNFQSGVLFTDEANFYVNEEVNHQNLHYWSDSNSHWTIPSKMQGAGKLVMWCGIWGNKIVVPVFFDTNINAEMYLNMLQYMMMLSLLNKDGDFSPRWDTTSLWYLHEAVIGSTVSEFVDWSLQSHGVAFEVPRFYPIRFLPVGTLESYV
jgi:hypothetical protein